MKTLKITTASHPCGSKRWASKVLEPRLVAVPDNAKTNDLRSKGVELIANGPPLVFWASGNQSRRYPSLAYFYEKFSEEAWRLAKEHPDEYCYSGD